MVCTNDNEDNEFCLNAIIDNKHPSREKTYDYAHVALRGLHIFERKSNLYRWRIKNLPDYQIIID